MITFLLKYHPDTSIENSQIKSLIAIEKSFNRKLSSINLSNDRKKLIFRYQNLLNSRY